MTHSPSSPYWPVHVYRKLSYWWVGAEGRSHSPAGLQWSAGVWCSRALWNTHTHTQTHTCHLSTCPTVTHTIMSIVPVGVNGTLVWFQLKTVSVLVHCLVLQELKLWNHSETFFYSICSWSIQVLQFNFFGLNKIIITGVKTSNFSLLTYASLIILSAYAPPFSYNPL